MKTSALSHTHTHTRTKLLRLPFNLFIASVVYLQSSDQVCRSPPYHITSFYLLVRLLLTSESKVFFMQIRIWSYLSDGQARVTRWKSLSRIGFVYPPGWLWKHCFQFTWYLVNQGKSALFFCFLCFLGGKIKFCWHYCFLFQLLIKWKSPSVSISVRLCFSVSLGQILFFVMWVFRFLLCF